MSDVIKIPRGSFDEKEDPKPCWVSVFTQDESGNKKLCKPVIRCQCGEYTNIALHHVHADGRVTNSFYHTNGNPCGWHVFLFLEGYAEEIGLDFPPDK